MKKIIFFALTALLMVSCAKTENKQTDDISLTKQSIALSEDGTLYIYDATETRAEIYGPDGPYNCASCGSNSWTVVITGGSDIANITCAVCNYMDRIFFDKVVIL